MQRRPARAASARALGHKPRRSTAYRLQTRPLWPPGRRRSGPVDRCAPGARWYERFARESEEEEEEHLTAVLTDWKRGPVRVVVVRRFSRARRRREESPPSRANRGERFFIVPNVTTIRGDLGEIRHTFRCLYARFRKHKCNREFFFTVLQSCTNICPSSVPHKCFPASTLSNSAAFGFPLGLYKL